MSDAKLVLSVFQVSSKNLRSWQFRQFPSRVPVRWSRKMTPTHFTPSISLAPECFFLHRTHWHPSQGPHFEALFIFLSCTQSRVPFNASPLAPFQFLETAIFVLSKNTVTLKSRAHFSKPLFVFALAPNNHCRNRQVTIPLAKQLKLKTQSCTADKFFSCGTIAPTRSCCRFRQKFWLTVMKLRGFYRGYRKFKLGRFPEGSEGSRRESEGSWRGRKVWVNFSKIGFFRR